MTETGKPIPQVAKDLGINETTLATWVSRARAAGRAGPTGESDELARLRREKAQLKRDNKELVMERDVLKRCKDLAGETVRILRGEEEDRAAHRGLLRRLLRGVPRRSSPLRLGRGGAGA
ncbi:transposase [Streptomyces sp. RPA4-5]|nr:transposase [Streptomyces sp. RPA4-5]